MLSVVIPARNERYLRKTIIDLLQKSKQNIEIIPVLDGYWPPGDMLVDDNRVHYLHFSTPRGMREAINAGVAISRGKFVMKLDAHCLVDDGFDEKLAKDCKDDWVVVPRRKRLDPEEWQLCDTHKKDIDYMYLSHPSDPSVWGGESLQGKEWVEKNTNDLKTPIDDLMTSQGSSWYMHRDYFYFLELMDSKNYGQFAKEMQEIGLKCWLSGGRMVVNKNTWYAHWHKPKSNGRGYSLSNEEFRKGSEYTRKWMDGKLWHKQTKKLSWLIEKFSPPGWTWDNIQSLRERDN